MPFYGDDLVVAPAARHGALSVARRSSPTRSRRRARRSSPSRCGAKAAPDAAARASGRSSSALGLRVLPNTAGCHSVKEAVTTAHMARELFDTPWIKLEVIGDARHPAARRVRPGRGRAHPDARTVSRCFPIRPRTSSSPTAWSRPAAEVLMPWGAPIGSARGLNNLYGLKSLRAHFPDVPLVVDAGLGRAVACRRGRWSWATTRCCSTPRSPRPAIRSRWRAPLRSPSRPGARPISPVRWSRATWPRPRRRCIGRAALGGV